MKDFYKALDKVDSFEISPFLYYSLNHDDKEKFVGKCLEEFKDVHYNVLGFTWEEFQKEEK
jgi:hypothetical protein